MKNLFFLVLIFASCALFAQTFTGIITDNETGVPLNNVEVTLVENDLSIKTTANGLFSFNAFTLGDKTLYFNKEGYVFEALYNQQPATNLEIKLRAKKISTATTRWNTYMQSCNNYNNPNIPNNPEWNVVFKETNLTGDLVANSLITRRDPSAVIKYNDKYYVWYSRKRTQTSTYFGTNNPNDNVFPWDYTDVYYATSTDGYEWKEQGPAVERGQTGTFDDRSVFTPEIFIHNDKFYLIYQVVKSPYIERVKNNVAMAVADSPNGPWIKLSEPILRPSHNGVWSAGSTSRFRADVKGDFDSHKVHDPCLMFYKDKFYLYYKGERMGEERFCGQREIRWGVAIADQPEGPYVKSEYNPITNTGHEVSVWNYNNGIAIIQKLDGPERGSIQFAQDGVNFEMMGTATGTAGFAGNEVPDALGIFRPNEISTTDPKFGVDWGLSHHLDFSRAANGATGGWMYLRRFDLVNKSIIPTEPITPVTGGNDLIVEAEDFIQTGSFSGIRPGEFNGVNATGIGINFVNSGDYADYSINLTETGFYDLTYLIASPGGRSLNVQLLIDGVEVASDVVPNTGDWENYINLNSNSNFIEITEGTHTFRIIANGNDRWQWNLDKLILKRVELTTSAKQLGLDDHNIVVYPNPAVHQIHISKISHATHYSIVDLKGVVVLQGTLKNERQSVGVEQLVSGTYILITKNGNNAKMSSTVFIKN
ncbi:family 43 glycosylhydrolase [Aquimarina agarivorans]|uniref:family 43 glycosylhydrolase n=1 Tax=Aquimarina agarivorans TaxID=980584 RepID=UPI000248EB09|nr:family 43 glycosylhydrolase [Aquimarina agarivorans]